MALRSQLSGIIANQIGRLQGELEAKIQEQASTLVSEFTSGCPDKKSLVQVAKTRNNLLKTINSFQRLLNRFAGIPSKLRPPISVAKIIIRLLKRNPTPLAIGTGPGPSGGLLFARTAGYTTRQADRIQKVNLLLEALEDDLRALEDLLSGIGPSMNNIKGILENVNTNVENCADELNESESSDAGNIRDILKEIQPMTGIGIAGSTQSNQTYRAKNGRDYVLQILEEKAGSGPVPRRFAIAKDSIGVVVLKGQPSFSSDTTILLEELKFRIDNQLP